MKTNRYSRSARTSVRLLIAVALCFAGFALALPAFGSWPAFFISRAAKTQKLTPFERKVVLQNRDREDAEKKVLATRRLAAKSRSSGQASTTPRVTPQTPLLTGPVPGVTTQTNAVGQTVYSVAAMQFDVSPPLLELAKLSIPEPPWTERPELELPPWRILRSNKPDPVTQVAPPARVPLAPNAPETASTGFNFEGIDGTPTGGFPPDTNGSVGNDQYVEMVNTRYQVWSLDRTTKTVTSLAGPASINTLWAGFGHGCQTKNSGDPIVVYDKIANRWFLSQFTSSADDLGLYYQCVAISTSPNAGGTYYRYAFPMPDANHDMASDFVDYPHYGVWTDAYYLMGHVFDASDSFVAAMFGAMDRPKMLAGDATATFVYTLDPLEGGHMPADVDGFAPPPTGAPGIFTSAHVDGMYLYRMHADFSTPANTTTTLQAKLPIAPATAPCGGSGGQCIPQPNSAFLIDSVGDRLMFRLAYRNFIDHESLVVSHSADPGVAGVVSGVRWYEFRLSGQPDAVCGSYPCTYQQGTVADDPNGRSRWMPSIAQDGAGNMIVGYSATGTNEATDAHSIRYTGRASNHALGTMTVPETIIFTGQRNIVSDPTAPVRIGRWGDYTSMSIDPADDCTFWHANEYYAATSAANPDWRTRIASVSFSPTQCQPTSCTSRPAVAPTGVTASAIAANQIQISWNAVAGAGSYAIERAVGNGTYEPFAYVAGPATSYIDTTVQGGLSYSYRVIAATDATGRCQSFQHSNAASATATGNCTLKPAFTGAASASSIDAPACGITINWSPAGLSCPLASPVRYNVYRGAVPDFVPSATNRIASCIQGPSSYVDTDNLTSGKTYFYVVRAEDTSTGNGGACGGNEDPNTNRIAGTAYGSGTEATAGTWTDGGGDGTSFLRLNTTGAGNTPDLPWRIIRTAEDPGANHTPGGDFAYRNAGPGPDANYGDLACSVAETPTLTVGPGATSVNLTYWERHQFESHWDGVALEYSRNNGPWTDLPPPSNSTADGCLTTDVTTDYATLECTDDPPINACAYSSTKPVITGPTSVGVECTTYMTGDLTAYARRCHRLTGLAAGDKIQFRWRFTSDPATAFKGFYLDDIAVTNIALPNACVPGIAVSPTPSPTPTATATASASPGSTASPTATATATASASPVTQAVNVSTRMRVDTGDNAGIGGFIVTGSAPKHVIIRGLGPSLTKFGFPSSELLADPTLELHGPQGFATVINNNWKDSQQTKIENSGLAPSNELEAAIDVMLAAGNYTAIVRGNPNGNGVGIGLVEVFDLDTSAASKLANLSTRALVRTGNNVVIAGFILGNNGGNDRIIVRGLGPSLTAAGVANPLADPTLELRDQNGMLLKSNNDWAEDSTQASEISGAGLAPSNPKESAVAATLAPGAYTAILAGANGGEGVGLVEVYDRGP
jgi:hypothetical protein